MQSQNVLGESLRNKQANIDRIKHSRLQKQYEFLKQLRHSYTVVDRYQIIIEQILQEGSNLHIFIPKQYPFKEPMYASSDNLQNRTYVSEVIQEWVPKIKILELVEIMAKRINLLHRQNKLLEQFMLYRAFRSIDNIALILCLGILLRILVGLGAYSGMGDYPDLGDFQAHRNWMSITVNRPIDNWYYESDERPWWRIDYPPIATYLSLLFGKVYNHIQPQAMKLQMGYQNSSLKSYMRFTALLVQVVLLFPALILVIKQTKNKLGNLFLLILLIKPDIILIDHGHFQYNSLILGLILLAFYCLLSGKYYLCCVCYTIAIHSKQMAVYYSLAFFTALIGLTYRDYTYSKKYIMIQLIKYGVIVIIVSLVIWAPWLRSIDDFQSVITAIFPIHRGLYQLKVPNFWCISDIFMKWESHFSKNMLVFLCFMFSVLFSIPSMIILLIKPIKKNLILSFTIICLTCFMFSYHVHQKSILLPLLMVPFLTDILGGAIVNDLVVAGCVGMFHLLKEDKQQLEYFVVVGIYLFIHLNYLTIHQNIIYIYPQSIQNQGILINWHKTIYNNNWRSYIFIVVLLLIHIAQKVIKPPSNLPYLHNLIFALFSFIINSYFLIIGNLIQIEQIYNTWNERLKKSI